MILTGEINCVMMGSLQYPLAIQWLVKLSPPSITLGRQRLGFFVTDVAIRGAIDEMERRKIIRNRTALHGMVTI
jgi:hypothetical protein